MRCAIYTRKSTADGLEQDFNSLDSQRECCANYIASQRSDGWAAIENSYDDGGYSGGTLRRPALTRLLADVVSGLIDVIVVYKIDRLSRSLRDFVNLVQKLEEHNVTFVAVTQSFNNTTSMGRLTLNVLLSFAQFEREVTGERLKDKFAGSRARGLWMHGARPFGYRVKKGVLSVEENEAAIVRRVYTRYPKIGSARLLANELTAAGILNKYGRPFTNRTVTEMLHSRLYVGELIHLGKHLPGVHDAIVTEKAWAQAQDSLAESGRRRTSLCRAPVNAMLKGLLFGVTGHAMVHTFVRSRRKLYRYYLLSTEIRYGAGTSPAGRYRAKDLENAILATLDRLITTPDTEPRSEAELTDLMRLLVERVDIGTDVMTITLKTGAVIRCAHAGRIG